VERNLIAEVQDVNMSREWLERWQMPHEGGAAPLFTEQEIQTTSN